MTCKNCWENGHNVRSCKNPKKDPPPKVLKPRGRPKKVNTLASTTIIGDKGLLPLPVNNSDEVHVGQENVTAGNEVYVADQMVEQETENVGNEHVPVTVEQSEYNDDMIDEQLDVISRQSSSEEETSDGEYEQPNRLCVESKKRKKSERIIKIKLSKPVYDEDGGGSTIDKPLVLD
ncbi:uncharacterized protein [Rutidosis leptorrhynchoides]|uniref:uncharacterized protein n=1 Tax=Rutidosis leptorrhynchoides TaxID=125765 RepID=UPI003A995E10